MRQAIILPYVTCQNEPSQPIAEVYDIPDNTVKRVNMLAALYREIFDPDGDDDTNVSLSYSKDAGVSFGDIAVTANGDCFLYVTYLK